jgi:hypothetical protein
MNAMYKRTLIPSHRTGQTCLLGNNIGLLRNVDTVKELTNILIANAGRLLDVGSRLRYVLNVITRQNDLILLSSRVFELDAIQQYHTANNLLSHEVADLYCPTILQKIDVDWKVSIDVAHLVQESLGDTGDHVLNVRCNGTNASDMLALSVPDADEQLLLRDRSNLYRQMTQILVQRTTRTSHCDFASGYFDGN